MENSLSWPGLCIDGFYTYKYARGRDGYQLPVKSRVICVSDTMISQQVSHRLLSGGLFLIKAPRRRNGCHLRQTAVSTVTVEFSDGGWREASFERQTLTSFIVDRERERERKRESWTE